jgi:hypothetical protein
MNESNITPQFEEDVRQSFGVPAVRSEFVVQLHTKIMQRATEKSRKPLQFFRLRPAWTIVLVCLIAMIIGTAVIGPQNVYAAVMKFLGYYIPGVGIIEETDGLRILAEPVKLTRDGITVSVNQVVITSSETRLNYGVSGVPLSAYPKGEAISGCIEREYLRLPDGTQSDINAPIPLDVNEATFVLPCIFNTLPETVPTNWEIALRFIPAPPDYKMLPVVEVSPQPSDTEPPSATEISQPCETPEAATHATVTVDEVIETDDGYILIGAIRPELSEGSWLQITGAAFIRDADGKKVGYSFPSDIQRYGDPAIAVKGGTIWTLQFKGVGIKFPLTVGFSGVVISQVDPQASTSLSVDVGSNPETGQVWNVNQDVEIAGKTIRLVSITAESNGYSFRIDPGIDLSGVSVQIEGYQAIGGGGGGGWQGLFNTSLTYEELPKGHLNILFTNPLAAGPSETWQVIWQPENVRDFPSSSSTENICWNADTIQSVPIIPTGLNGKVIFTQLNPEMEIVMANLDGSQQQVIVKGSYRASLGLNADRLVYTSSEGVVIKNILTGESTILSGSFGYDAQLSPDGTRIAYVNSGEIFGIFVIDNDGKNQKQLSNLGYESIAGWSPDGSHLYYAIPGSSGDGFLLRSVDVIKGEARDLFILDNSSGKAPMPAVSPNGNWIAYRGSDNSSLYLKNMDGTPARLLLDHPSNAINGIVWENDGHLLGVSLITPQNPDGEIILIAPDNCETYRLPGLSGELDAVFIP